MTKIIAIPVTPCCGIATSQNIATRLETILKEKNINNFKIDFIKITTFPINLKNADIFINVGDEKNHLAKKIPIFDGTKILSGLNLEKEINKIILEINK